SNDHILLIDGVRNVDLTKQVRPIDAATGLPSGTAATDLNMVVPNEGELAAADYPRARYTLTARNSSTMPTGARGAMKLAKIRVADPRQRSATPETGGDFDESPYTGFT